MNAAFWIVGCATGITLMALALDRWLANRFLLARAALWNAVVIALVALPLAALLSPRVELAWLPALDHATIPAAELSHPAPRPAMAPPANVTIAPPQSKRAFGNLAPTETPRESSMAAVPSRRTRDFLPDIWQALAAVYGLGVMLMLARLLAGWRAVQALRHGATCEAPHTIWRSRMEHWTRAINGFPVELSASKAVDVPVALGVLRPAIVLPADVAASADPRVVDAVLVHELAHIARRDCGWQVLGEVARAVWWFHPLVWLSLARMALVRERACDDFAIHHLRDREGYCLTLVDMVSRLARQRPLGLAMAVVRTNQLSTRLAAIRTSIGSEHCQLAPTARRPLFVFAAMLTLALASVSLVRAQADPPAEARTTKTQESPAPAIEPTQADGRGNKSAELSETKGDLSLTVELLDVEGQPVRDGWVLFYRAVDKDDPPSASDWIEGEQRWSHVRSDVKDRLTAKNLTPGVYRCIALTDFSRIFGYAIGSPIELDGGQQHTTTKLQLQPGATVTMRAVDSISGEPIAGARVSLEGVDDRMPQGNYGSSPPEDTSVTFHHLPLGRYRFSAERMANRPDQTDYPEVKVAEPVELTADKPQELVAKLVAKPRTEEETLRRWPFVVEGVVRDADGQPLPGATVAALQQVRWLPVTGRATTDAEGRYTLRFGPGLGGSESLPRATIIEASRPGFSETNINRQGGLTMALGPTEPAALPPNSFPRVILPEAPQTIDFALTPAANIDVEILDERNEPARDKLVWLMGNELPPLADELADGRLNDAGEYHIDNVPLNQPWFVTVQWREAMKHEDVMLLRTPTFVLREPGEYRVRAKYEKHPATGLDQLRILRILTPSNARSGASRFRTMQRDVTEQARTDDPLWLAPLPEAQQVQGRDVLRKLAEANRHWLGRPVDAVKNYQYEFHRLENKPGEYHVDTFHVDKPQSDGLWFVHGITYSPLVTVMAKNPDLVAFQLVEVGADKIRLVYSLTKPIMMQAGNGIEHTWRGYFSNNRAHHGELLIDAPSLRLISHKTDDWTETFADYVEVAPGHAVPRHVKIDHGDMKFDWKFKVYEPGLWLFDSSRYSLVAPDERVVYIDNVQINGQPAKEMP